MEDGALRGKCNGRASQKSSSFIVGLDFTKDVEQIGHAYADPTGLNVAFILNAPSNADTAVGYETFELGEWTVIGA